MQTGFFSGSSLRRKAKPRVARCGACGLCKGCRSPKMPPTGEGRRKVLVVAEAPGEMEDREGTQLVGKTGRRLRRELEAIGVDLDRDCWKTNAVACRPPGKPTDRQIERCRANVLGAIEEFDPDVVLLLGGPAIKSVIGFAWQETVGEVGRWVGWRVPCREPNVWICPIWHPSYIEREGSPVLDLIFRGHLKAAFDLKGKPEIHDYRKDVQVVQDTVAASAIVGEMIERGGPLAFDYETNMLKPDHPDAEIVSCAVCWRGKRTVAYPFAGPAVDATRDMVRSGSPKIAANAKFEERWSRAILGTPVANWRHDTMLAGHLLDPRSKTTGLKFQAFALLGQGDYDSEVSPYLKGVGGSRKNRVRELDWRDLLLYNGTDARLEYELATVQAKQIGIRL